MRMGERVVRERESCFQSKILAISIVVGKKRARGRSGPVLEPRPMNRTHVRCSITRVRRLYVGLRPNRSFPAKCSPIAAHVAPIHADVQG